EELPIDKDGLAPDQAWYPTGLVRDGRHLLFRHADAELLEVAAVDLAIPSTPYPAVQVAVPELQPPADDPAFEPFPWPSAWLTDGWVVIEFFYPFQPSGGSNASPPPTRCSWSTWTTAPPSPA